MGEQERWSFRIKDKDDPNINLVFTCKADSSFEQFMTKYYGQYEMFEQAMKWYGETLSKEWEKAFSEIQPSK